MKNKSNLMSVFLLGTCLLTMASCGNSDSDSSGSVTTQEQQQGDQGIYRAVLSPINSAVAGNTVGTVEITIENDEFIAESNITGAPANVKHLQNITTATACPDAAADTNNDTFIDIGESFNSTGLVLIPLDSDLSNQLDGMTFGPIANGAGTYSYKRRTSLSSLLTDLGAPDPDVSDAVVKLPAGSNLNLAGRVVVIHGVRSTANLPESVVTVGDNSNETVLPIACGQLVRVTSEDAPSEEPGTGTDTPTEEAEPTPTGTTDFMN